MTGRRLEIVVEPWREGLWPALRAAAVADAAPAKAEQDASSTTPTETAAATAHTPAVNAPDAREQSGGDGAAVGISIDDLKLPKLGPPYIEVMFGQSKPTNAESAGRLTSESNGREWMLGELKSRRKLTGEGAIKRAVDIIVNFDADVNYMPGDIFAVACPNDRTECNWLISRLGCESVADDECVVTVLSGTKKARACVPQHLAPSEATSIRRCLGYLCDIRGVSVNKHASTLSRSASDQKTAV